MINSVNYQHQHCPITIATYELNSLMNMHIGDRFAHESLGVVMKSNKYVIACGKKA